MIKKPTCHITTVLRDTSFFDGYKKYIESLIQDDILTLFRVKPLGRRVELFSDHYLDKFKLKSMFYRLGICYKVSIVG